MAQLSPSQYKKLSDHVIYGVSYGLYWDTTNSLLCLVLNDAVVLSINSSGTILAGALEAADLNIASQARGDILRRGASEWQRLDAKTSGQILIGDGTDVVSVAISGDATISAAGALTVADVTVGSDAAGDLLYKSSATALARLAKGTSGQFLRMNAAGTLPSWQGSAVKVLSDDFNALATTAQLAIVDYSGAAPVATWGIQHLLSAPSGNIYGVIAKGGNQTLLPVIVANGLDIGGDQTDDEGYEIFSHFLGATGRPFIVGTDAAFYFTCKFEITDADGLDTLIVGFRRAEAQRDAHTNYADYAGLGLNTAADPMAVKTITELNGGGTTVTDTTQTLAQATAVQFKVLVSAAGVVTFQHDIVTPGTLAAPTAVGTMTFDAGDPVIPFFHFLNSANLADGVIIHSWDAGYQ